MNLDVVKIIVKSVGKIARLVEKELFPKEDKK
jgi:hypothetical protein